MTKTQILKKDEPKFETQTLTHEMNLADYLWILLSIFFSFMSFYVFKEILDTRDMQMDPSRFKP